MMSRNVELEQRVATDPSSFSTEASETRKTGTWFKSLSKETREAIQDLHRIDPRWNVVVFVFIGLWVIGAWATANTSMILWRLPGYLAMGVSIHGLVVLMHEGIHGSLFRSKTLDRWFGFLLGIPTWVSYTAYRITHLAHHRHNRTEKDPDEIGNLSRRRWLLSAAFYAWMIAGTFVYFLVHVPATALSRSQGLDRRRVLGEYGCLVAIYVAVFLLGWRYQFLPQLVHFWLIPMIAAVICGNIRGWAEHMMTIPGNPLTQTRTVTSNRIVSFLTLNLNYHLEHHLFPGIPWYNLPKVHALLLPEYRRAGAFIYKSYLRFLIDAVRAGVHGYAPEQPSGRGLVALERNP